MPMQPGPAATLRRLRSLTLKVAQRADSAQSADTRRLQLLPLAYGLARRRLLAAGARSMTVSVAGVPLHTFLLDDQPPVDTPPIVFLHGIADRAETWSLLLPLLRRSATLYAPDLPGFGASSPPAAKRAASIDDLVSSVVAFLDTIVGRPAILVGNSMGGWIAARVAARHPHLVAGLALLDPGGAALSGLRSWLPFLRHLLLETRTARRRTLATIYHRVPLPLYAAPDVLIGLFHQPNVLELVAGLTPADLLSAHELAQISAPTLLVWGANDRFLPPDSADFFRRHLPGAQSVILARCGHLPHQEHPIRTARVLRSFVHALHTEEDYVFLNGPRPATLTGLQMVDIHGTRLVDLTFQLDGEPQPRRARIGTESVSGSPLPGQRIIVSFVMGVATAVQPAADA